MHFRYRRWNFGRHGQLLVFLTTFKLRCRINNYILSESANKHTITHAFEMHWSRKWISTNRDTSIGHPWNLWNIPAEPLLGPNWFLHWISLVRFMFSTYFSSELHHHQIGPCYIQQLRSNTKSLVTARSACFYVNTRRFPYSKKQIVELKLFSRKGKRKTNG